MPKFRPQLDRTDWTPEELSELAQIKRFMERHQGDPKFRERLPTEMKPLAEEFGFTIDPEEIRSLWDVDIKLKIHNGEMKAPEPSRILANYRKWISQRIRWRDGIRAGCEPHQEAWKLWRERQINRANSEMGEGWCASIIFDTAAIELSKGCSVGCWFCGVDAPRLEDHLYFTPENEKLFKGVMEVMVGFVGARSAAAHFLYWASDPFDNPDYEDYCRAYRDVIGVYPLTTTAMCLKDVDRTRRILQMLLEDESGVHRFSVLTLKMLNRIHEEFTPEELLRVELVLLNKESKVVKANAGRFRSKADKKPKLRTQEENKMPLEREFLDQWQGYAGPGTIACVSGLLLNLVERTAKLISPCKANDRWPLGYIVYQEGKFETPEELQALIESWIGETMKTRLGTSEVVRFRPDLIVKVDEDGFSAFTPHGGGAFTGGGRSAFYHDLGAMIEEGTHQAGAIADTLLAKHGIFHEETYRVMDWLYDNGLLNDEPEVEVPAETLVQLVGSKSAESVSAPARVG